MRSAWILLAIGGSFRMASTGVDGGPTKATPEMGMLFLEFQANATVGADQGVAKCAVLTGARRRAATSGRGPVECQRRREARVPHAA